MRKIIFTAFLFSVLTSAWSFDYYESNMLGMKFGSVMIAPPEDSEFILRVEINGEMEVQTLFNADEIYFSRTIERVDNKNVETTVKGNVTETVIRKKGLMISEAKKENGKPIELVQYNYEQERLESSVYSSGEEEVYTETYSYTPESRLLDVKRVYSDGVKGAISSFMFKGGRIRNFWSKDIVGQSLLKFDNEGIFFSEILSDDGWSETREYGRDEYGRKFERIRNGSGELVYLVFSEAGSLLSSTAYDAEGVKTEQQLFLWDDELLVHLTVKKDLSVEKYIYEYDGNGKLLNESYSVNGSIIQETIYHDENERVELLFKYGEPILRLTYRDGERVSTEQLQE
jgi:hypothetical protein